MSEQYLVDGLFQFEKSKLSADVIGRDGSLFYLLIDGKKENARIDSVS